MTVSATEVEVCRSGEVAERGRLVFDIGEMAIGIFRLRGELHAYENTCPHRGGPVCQGLLIPGVREVIGSRGETVAQEFDEADLHVVCPWHGYEYSIATGRHAGPGSPRLRSFPVREAEGVIYVEL